MESAAPEYEEKILRDVIEQMPDRDKTLRSQTLVRRVIFALGYSGLIVAFVFAISGMSHPFSAAFLAAASGCAPGFGIFLNFAHEQWPITRNHINLESVERRLKELETANKRTDT